MNIARFERMVGIPEDEYIHLKSLQQVHNPLQNKFQTLTNEYNTQEFITNPYTRNQRQAETLNSMINLKDEMRKHLVQVTPRPYQSRAENLYNFISNKMTINEKGEMMDRNGKVVEGSNISDLIQHAVRDRRRNITPPGWEEFKTLLKDANAPRMILNYETLEEMHHHMKDPLLTTSRIKSVPTAARTSRIPIASHMARKRLNSAPGKEIRIKKELSLRKRRLPSYLDNYLVDTAPRKPIRKKTYKQH